MNEIKKPKKKIIIKKKKTEKTVQKTLENKHNNKNLNQSYLDYDYDIDEEFKKTLPSNSCLDLSKLNNIINTNCIIKKIENVEDDDNEELEEINEKEESNIDIDELDKQIIGNKIYLIDYNKGIIYNTNYNIIGNIDDYGEINIDN